MSVKNLSEVIADARRDGKWLVVRGYGMAMTPDEVVEAQAKGTYKFPVSFFVPVDPHELASVLDERLVALTKERDALRVRMGREPGQPFNFASHLIRQRIWSAATFGPGRLFGCVQHIRKELEEIEAEPTDLKEWIDVVILALDGAWRSGAEAEQIIAALVAKQTTNEARVWPDWRTQPADTAIEHVKTEAV